MSEEITKPKGTQDVYGKKKCAFDKVREVAKRISSEYNFESISTPIMEEKRLFVESVGEASDIVQKEMYSFETKGGDELTLRPEGTASVVRCYIENDFYKKPQPVKLFYWGPFFRYESPQKGRYRQFHQFGLEILGKGAPALDAQLILILSNIFDQLEIDVEVDVNSIGDECCRPDYKEELVEFLESYRGDLCEDCDRRLEDNSLRVLDCKNEDCRDIIKGAPQTVDHLCKNCRKRFKKLLEYLDSMEIPYKLNPFLVRGLDYYTNVVFEFFAKESELALGGGGRYDKLVELLGGRETPASGAAVGVERTVEAMGELKKKDKPQVFLAQLGEEAKKEAFRLYEEFRREGVKVAESMGRNSLNSQLSKADKEGADYTLILGKKECIKKKIIIREMETGKQETVGLDEVVKKVKDKIN